MEARALVQCLLDLSEQASNLACLIREDEQLNELLIASKSQRLSGEPDFKTLADVLIQATIRYGLHKQFPDSEINVRGEEDGTFPGRNGKTITLDISDDPQNTKEKLGQVLDDAQVVGKLSDAVHRQVQVHDDFVSKIGDLPLPKGLNVWIDPIDSTKSYISGSSRLESVTVLIGVHYEGVPIIGVITYPFSKSQIWGLYYQSVKISNIPPPPASSSPIQTVYLSTTASEELQDGLRSSGYHVEVPSGAGFKLGGVIRGQAAIYYVGSPSTFQWDTCGPHAILRVLGGGLVPLATPSSPLVYTDSTDPNPPFVAFSTRKHLDKFLTAIS